jgi:DNA mismatch repair protein MutL
MKIVAVAQALGTYILAEHDSSGLFLIEQHVAHERILFEGLRDGWATSFVPLPADRAVALPAAIARDDERLLALSALGFDVAVGEDGDYATATVRSVPSLLAGAPREELLAAVAALSAGDGAGGSVDEAAASLACRTAVKNGAVLSRKQMDRIVADLARCRNPHTCPHGRPVFFEIGHRDLAAIFQRRWIPKLAAAGGKRARRRVRGVL